MACNPVSTPLLLKVRTNIHSYFKRGILFYIKGREIPNDSGILHMANKVYPKFRNKKNGVKNATLTKWLRNTNL